MMSNALSEALARSESAPSVADPENDQEKPEVIDTVVQGILLAARETRVATIRNSGTGSVWWCPFCDRSHQEMYRVCNSRDCMAEVEIASDQHADGRITQRATATKTIQTRLDVPPFLAGLLAHGATPEQLAAMEAAVKGELVSRPELPKLSTDDIYTAMLDSVQGQNKSGLVELAEALSFDPKQTRDNLLIDILGVMSPALVGIMLREVRSRLAV